MIIIITEQQYKKLTETLINEAIPTLRTLTYKSKLGFGTYGNITVGDILKTRNKNRIIQLVSAYYKLTSINYMPDVLADIGIVGEYVIQKPGKDIDLYYKFLDENGYKKRVRTRDGSNALKRSVGPMSSSQLQRMNHGK